MNVARLIPPVALALALATPASSQGDPAVIERIIEEGTQNSHVWETLTYLSEEIGPRLTGSTNLARANDWTRDTFASYGLTDAHLHKWGEIPVRFDRGPSTARMVAPEVRELEFTTRAWGAGTDGPLRARVMLRPESLEELEAVRDSLEGAWLLGDYRRRSRRGRGGRGGRGEEDEAAKLARELREAMDAALSEIEFAGRLNSSSNDLVRTGGSWRDLTMDTLPENVEVTIRRTDFEAMQELIQGGVEVEVEVDLEHHFSEGPIPVFNTVAEIRGSELPEEVIILSAHLDSWDGPGSQGAQDNGTGSSVMLEAARILMAAGVSPKRTIRFCLWTGEEQGLYGSRGYVESLSEQELAGISAAFVDDGGTNFEGGLMCIESMLPMLDQAIAPIQGLFPDMEVLNVVTDRMPKGGASDHASFNRVGVPGFFWIEKGMGGREEKSYGFIHHTQHDTTRYAVPEYLVQSATCSAVTAYNLAMAESLLPRQLEEEPEAEAPDASFVVAPGPLSGTWEAALVGEGAPDMSFTLELEMAQDGRLRGMLKSIMGEARIKDGKWNAETSEASFGASGEMGRLEFKASLAQGVLSGSFDMGASGIVMNFTAQKQAPAATPLSGTWDALLIERDSAFKLHFEVAADGSVTGWLKSSRTDSKLYSGRWDAESGELSFEYDYPDAGRLSVTAELKDGLLRGVIGDSAEFEATRVEGGQ